MQPSGGRHTETTFAAGTGIQDTRQDTILALGMRGFSGKRMKMTRLLTISVMREGVLQPPSGRFGKRNTTPS